MFGGGLVGSAGREGAAALLAHAPGEFPAAVLAVNLIGALTLGWFLSRRQQSVSVGEPGSFWAIGVLGSFTTFSAFSLDTLRLVEVGRPGVAAAYVTASIFGGLLLALIGQRLGAIS